MTDSNELVRSSSLVSEAESVASFLSDDVQEIDDDEQEMKKYDKAPYDVMFNCDGKDVRVVKEGEAVPCETKYKRVSSTTAVKFRFGLHYNILF